MSDSGLERLRVRDEADARELTLRVPEGHPCFRGHFPGEPIVPGVVVLHWAVGELARWQRRALDVAGLEALKFRRPLRPGATFVLRLARASDPAALGFELCDDDGPISSGRVRVRP